LADLTALLRLRRTAENERDRSNYITNSMINALRSHDPTRDGKSVTVYELLGRWRRQLDSSLTRDSRFPDPASLWRL
jgi:hypothetical protein